MLLFGHTRRADVRSGDHDAAGAPGPAEVRAEARSGELAQRNTKWLYHNGVRYLAGYQQALAKYSLAVLFSSFLMGEILAATIFHQMAADVREPVFQEALRNIDRDEGRHMAICMTLMERDYPKLAVEDRALITKQTARRVRHP